VRALLALTGARRRAAEINVALSLATLIAAAAADARVIGNGVQICCSEQFFVDPFNVFLVALTAFVNFTTALFSRRYMRVEEHRGRPRPGAHASVPRPVPALHVHDAARAAHQQHGPAVGCDGSRDAVDRAAGVAVSHAASLEAAWKYFILCGVGIAQALFGTILLYFAAERVLGHTGTARCCGRSSTR
jgi:hydrogenase-4 component F